MNIKMSKRLTILAMLLSMLSIAADKNIPLEVFAEPAKYKTIQISPSGKYLAFTYEDGTEVKMGVLERETLKPTAGFEFGENRHVVGFDWLNDERLSMTVQTRVGWLDGTNPRTYWAAANADGSNRRVLWDDRNLGSLTMIDTLKDEPDHVLAVRRMWLDGGKVKLFKVNTENNKQSYISDSPKAAAFTDPGVIGFGTDTKGNVRFALEYDNGEDENIPDDDTISLHYKNKNSDE
ncbi:MAG: hypothetical protein HKP09_04135, partial [Enterobacterales bacterium]|nr:hypothetical protein [Enterobacterales bacterium]